MERKWGGVTEVERTNRTTVKRLPKRAAYDRETIDAILDEGFICHVGFVVDGQPYVIPTGYARIGDRVYIHGSQASRMLKTLSSGVEVCVTVTLLDGLVLARSAFHHSMNYRSVVLFGKATVVGDDAEKAEALRRFVDQIIPGRSGDARGANEAELRATTVLSLPLEEVSAKVRTGPPLDDEEDYDLDVWAGVIPLSMITGEPVVDPRLKPGIGFPSYLQGYSRKRTR